MKAPAQHRSLADQLESFRRQQMPGAPRIHQVMRVMARAHRSEVEPDLLRDTVLDWVVERVGALPPAARSLASFEHALGGVAASAVRLVEGDIDYWVVRCDDPAKNVPGRVWSTEVSVVANGDDLRVGLRLDAVSREPTLKIGPAVPTVMRSLTEAARLRDAALHPLCAEPWLVQAPAELANLIELIEAKVRTLPVVVLTLATPDSPADATALDAVDLARKAVGLAHVAVVTAGMTYGLSDRWGKEWSAFNGAVRLYRPGFDVQAQSPYDHPLTLRERVQGWPDEHGCSFGVGLRRELAGLSLRQLGGDHELPAFSRVRQAALQREREQAAAGGHDGKDLLALAEAELAEKQHELDEARGEAERALSLAAEEEAARLEMEEELRRERVRSRALADRVAELERRGVGSAVEAQPALRLPQSFDVLQDWSDVHLNGRVVVSGKAVRMAKRSKFENPALGYEALLALAEGYWPMKTGQAGAKAAFDARLASLKLANERTGERTGLQESGEEFFVQHEGRRLFLDWHLKTGGTSRDPRRCFRLYYTWDDESARVVVGALPEHLRVSGLS